MAAPAVGTVVDGYRFNGGDPNNQASWAPVGKSGQVYSDTLAREQAKDDVERLTSASQGQREAYGMEATARQAEAIIPNTPTGAFADQRVWAGTNMPALGALPFVPNRQETNNLKTLERLGSMGSLGDVGKLKGPLSEKELAFIQRMQFDPGASREYNQTVADAMKWVARRQAAYGAALKKWTQALGSPSASNASGLDFDSWWGRYSSERLPAPGTSAPAPSRPRPAPRPSAAAAQGDGWKVLSVE